MEFKEYNLIECVSEIIDYRGKTPKKLGGEWDDNGDYRAISAKNIKNNKIVNEEAMKKVNKEIYMKWMKKEVKKGDILLTSEAPLGETYYWDSEEKIVLSQRIYGIRANENIIKSRYLFAYMQSRNFSHELTSRESGTTVTGIRQSELEKVKIKIPVLSIQKYIGDTIFNLNQKIQVNSEIINTLEKISQTFFKQWFIDFEFPNEEGKPYKSSGGEMVESELGEIPKGWEVDKLSNIAEIVMGQSPKSETYNNENIGLPLLNGATDFKNRNISPNKYTSDAKKIGKKGDFVFGVRATIGLVTELDNAYAIGRGAGIASPLIKEGKEYLYEILKKAFNEFQYTASGSVYINISKNDLKDYKLVNPTNNITQKYHSIVSAIMFQKENLIQENKNLNQLRDTLLPKLLSGEIEIPDDLEV